MLDELLLQVENLKSKSKKLNSHETLQFLDAFKHLSSEKELLKKLIQQLSMLQKNTVFVEVLTQRENEIFKLIGIGFSSAEISTLLNISVQTVGTHRKNIIKKLQLSGSGQLQKKAYFQLSLAKK